MTSHSIFNKYRHSHLTKQRFHELMELRELDHDQSDIIDAELFCADYDSNAHTISSSNCAPDPLRDVDENVFDFKQNIRTA